jgi:hypothetical protein
VERVTLMNYEDPPLLSHEDADKVLSAALRGKSSDP